MILDYKFPVSEKFDEAGGSVYTFLNSLRSLIKDLKTMHHVKYIVTRGSIYPLLAGIYK